MKNTDRKVLVIGGTGLISSAVTSELIRRTFKVTLLNRGTAREKIEGVDYITADVKKNSMDELQEKISGKSWDAILDFVSYTKNQLKKILKIFDGKYQQYIFISTASVCINEIGKITEKDVIEYPQWKYAFDKKTAETYLENFHEGKNSWYTIIRPYITYSEKRLPLQFSPLKYYTNINRIKCGKPLPVCEANVHTTFTSDQVFAVGCAGLIMNPSAKNESFNVTGGRSMSWEEIYHRVYSDLSKKEWIVEIPLNFINLWEVCGFDKDEILYDKALDRKFDNRKINNAVSEFEKLNDTKFYYDFKHVIEYYNTNSDMQIIDYKWDARIDNMLAKWYRRKGIREYDRSLSIKAYTNRMKFKDRFTYLLYRYDTTFLICKAIGKLKKYLYEGWK